MHTQPDPGRDAGVCGAPDARPAGSIVPRRTVLKAAGATGLALGLSPILWRRPAIAGAPQPTQVHLQFGADPARQMLLPHAAVAVPGPARL
jgi:hypothetical protein